MRPFSRQSLSVPAEELAPALLGAVLVRTLADGTRLAGRVVETEAYVGVRDRCSHAFGGRRTARNGSMYARAGTAYVYFTYGMHHCFNVVCGSEGEPVAVLVRALEPLEGLERMREHRRGSGTARRVPDEGLCSGPGKLCQALAIDRGLDGWDLLGGGGLELGRGAGPARVVRTARIGVGGGRGAGEGRRWVSARLRWYDGDSPHVSVRKKP